MGVRVSIDGLPGFRRPQRAAPGIGRRRGLAGHIGWAGYGVGRSLIVLACAAVAACVVPSGDRPVAASPAILNDQPPAWSQTGSLRYGRSNALAVTLHDGRVAVFGDTYSMSGEFPVEIYDPASGRFTQHGTTWCCGLDFAAALVDGRVLVAPASSLCCYRMYDPVKGTTSWFDAPPYEQSRQGATGTVLPDGKVLVAGGSVCTFDTSTYPYRTYCGISSSAYIFDPINGQWRQAGYMNWPRTHATATLLPDGRVLVAGGECDISTFTRCSASPLNTSEIYDRLRDRWTPTSGRMAEPRSGAVAVRMPDGQVMELGGVAGSSLDRLLTNEIYDARLDRWLPAAPLPLRSVNPEAVALADGRVLAVDESGRASWLYMPARHAWVYAGQPSRTRWFGTLAALRDGTAILVGGRGCDGVVPVKVAERWNPAGSVLPPPTDVYRDVIPCV